MEEELKKHLDTYLGYPCNTSYDFSEVLSLMNIHINNVGCPFSSSTYKANTKIIERQVLEYFADLWGIDNNAIWGYITNGGTEGNIQGLYVGREVLGDSAIFYTSEESHYSIFKIARLLKLNLKIIKSCENGQIDYHDFESQLLENKNAPCLINLNLGTTMKGAIDDPQEIHRILRKHNKHQDYYMHADGALMGFCLPFLESDMFFRKHIHSISISGHKFLGIPFPCGVFIMEKRFLEKVTNNIEYIGSKDCTVSGSRNGHSPLLLQHIITKKTYQEFRADIDKCIELSEYLVGKIPNSWRNHNSITVVFPKPSQDLCEKWQLASSKEISHVVVMPHVTQEKLDKFIADYLLEL